MAQFLNTPEDCQWLRETFLKDVDLPPYWQDFKSYVMHNEVSDIVDLYKSDDPLHSDTFLQVREVTAVRSEVFQSDGCAHQGVVIWLRERQA